MRSLLLVPFLLLPAACSTSEPVEPVRSDAEDRAALVARIDQFHTAIREGDKDSYSDVFAPSFLFTWARDGQLYDREVILPNVVPTPGYQPIVDEVRMRIHDDSAVVNYRVRREERDTGVRVTFSFVRLDGRWKVIASHSTNIVDESASDELSDDS